MSYPRQLTTESEPTTRRFRPSYGVMALILALILTATSVTLAAPSSVPSAPVALGESAEFGPWDMRVVDVLTGEEAADLVLSASPLNAPVREGSTFVAVRIEATNRSAAPQTLHTGDFMLIGGEGWTRRLIGSYPPDPAIDTTVAPGETHTGWVILGGPDGDPNLVLVYDSMTLTGNWADGALALTDGGAIPVTDITAEPDQNGAQANAPAAVGTVITTAEWQAEVLRVARGTDAYDLFPENDRRTTALGRLSADNPNDPTGAIGWLAVEVRVTNLQGGDSPTFLTPTAFQLAQPDGTSLFDGLHFTPPMPDASGWYMPGETRVGWVLFEVKTTWTGNAIRFLPYRTDQDPRYLSLS